MICVYQSRYLEKLVTRPIEATLALNDYHSIVGMDHLVADPQEVSCGFFEFSLFGSSHIC